MKISRTTFTINLRGKPEWGKILRAAKIAYEGFIHVARRRNIGSKFIHPM
jgi:hypothetical protein